MVGKYKRKDGTLFDVIFIRGRYERGTCKDLGNRLFSRVTEEEIKKGIRIR